MSRYDKVTDEVILATVERPVNASMKSGQDADDTFTEKTLARSEVAKAGENLSDQMSNEICV